MRLKRNFTEYYVPPKGKGIRDPIKYKATAYVVFPYVKGDLISENEIGVNFPAWEYLMLTRRIASKSMGGKRDVKGSNDDVEVSIRRTQCLKENDSEKIIVGVMSSDRILILIEQHGFSSGGTAGYISITLKAQFIAWNIFKHG